MDIVKVVELAEAGCKAAGVKLTAKRKNVLTSLLKSNTPLSAYEIAEHYKTEFAESISAMSVYRMLDFLIEQQLVHKLSSTNKYIACSHIACQHQHEIPQFLICDACNSVAEVGIKRNIINELKQSVESTGFQMHSQQLELHGICQNCSG